MLKKKVGEITRKQRRNLRAGAELVHASRIVLFFLIKLSQLNSAFFKCLFFFKWRIRFVLYTRRVFVCYLSKSYICIINGCVQACFRIHAVGRVLAIQILGLFTGGGG